MREPRETSTQQLGHWCQPQSHADALAAAEHDERRSARNELVDATVSAFAAPFSLRHRKNSRFAKGSSDGDRQGQLPSKKFAYVDLQGRGHLAIGDAAHVRYALGRFDQTFFESASKARTAWSYIMAAAKKFGIDVSDKEMPQPKIKQASAGYKRASAERAELSPHLSRNEAGEGQAGRGRAAENVSICAVVIAAEGVPDWIELIPAGKFSAVDGRGPFENEKPDQVVAASIAKMPEVGLVLDYDHSTDLAAPEGRPAPAAGWIKGFKVENGAIFAQVEWTKEAAAALEEKKYRYVSPVFEHDKHGKVERILRAALTNNPALINLPALAQSEDAGFLARQPRAGMTRGRSRAATTERRRMLGQ
jgi:Mu-like prophage I protein